MEKVFLLKVANAIKLYAGIIWKASSELESREIQAVFGEDLVPLIAPDLPPRQILPDFSTSDKPRKTSGALKLIFLSRIDRKRTYRLL